MRIYKKIGIEKTCIGINDYAYEALRALEAYTGCSGSISAQEVEVRNYILPNHVILMNIKEISGKKVNNHYAFLYLSINPSDINKLTDFIFKTNSITSDDPVLKSSAVMECGNRAGARLLRFISKTGSSFDIGTPILYPFPPQNVENPDENHKLWPFNFFSMKMNLAGIPVEFGCSILESPEQRAERLLKYFLGKLRGAYTIKLEKESKLAELPAIFNQHFVSTTLDDERVILSMPMKYCHDFIDYLIIKTMNPSEIKNAFCQKIEQIPCSNYRGHRRSLSG